MNRYYFELTDEEYNGLDASIPDGNDKIAASLEAKAWMRHHGMNDAMLIMCSMKTGRTMGVYTLHVGNESSEFEELADLQEVDY